MDGFTKAFIEALFFTESDTDNLGDAGINEISTELMTRITQECLTFQSQADGLIVGENCHYKGCLTAEYAGHDFWLTRNGHGCGYTDGDWAEPAATKLYELSKSFGMMEVYLGDDGKVYSV